MVDDLLLVDRGAQFGQRLLVVAVKVPDLLFLAGERAGARDQRLGHLFVGDLDVRPGADFRQQQAEAHAALGDLAIVGAGRLLRGVLVGEAAARGLLLARHLRPDRIELLIDQALRQFEGIERVELVEELALDLVARSAGDSRPRSASRIICLELVEALEAEALGEFVVDREAPRAPRPPSPSRRSRRSGRRARAPRRLSGKVA